VFLRTTTVGWNMQHRRASLPLVFFLLFSFWICFAQPEELEVEQPKVEALQSQFDFGEIYQGEKVQHVFKIRNAGSGVLKVLSIRASCGCTAVVVSDDDKKLSEGEEGEIKVTFRSASKRGRQNRIVTVTTNDPATPQLKLSLQGLVKERIVLEPAFVRFGEVERGTVSEEAVVTLTPADEVAFEIKEVSVRSRVISWEWDKREDGSYEVKVVLAVDEKVPPGIVHDALVIKTTHPEIGVVRVPITWQVVCGIRVHPLSVALFRRGGQNVEASFTMTKPKGVPFKIEEITNLPDFVTYTTELLPGGKNYRVKLNLEGDIPLGRYDRSIVVHTDDPENSAIPVRLFVRVEPEAVPREGSKPQQKRVPMKPQAIPSVPQLKMPKPAQPVQSQ